MQSLSNNRKRMTFLNQEKLCFPQDSNSICESTSVQEQYLNAGRPPKKFILFLFAPISLFSFIFLRKMKKDVKTLKNIIRPANDMQSTYVLVEIHNSPQPMSIRQFTKTTPTTERLYTGKKNYLACLS